MPTSSDGIRRTDGAAYPLNDDSLAYRETHWMYVDHGGAAQLVMYFCPDGKPFARKLMHARGQPQAPDFTLDDARTGYREGVRSVRGQREMFVRTDAAGKERTTILTDSPNLVIDIGFDAFVQAHWNDLREKTSRSMPFALPSRLRRVNLRVQRLADTQVDGRRARAYRISLASWLGFALPHIDVTYDANTRELMRFVGAGSIRGSNGHHLRVRVELTPRAATAATRAELDAAAQAPLSGRCTLP